MTKYRVEHTGVLAAGFLAGAALAMCIAPGDIFLWVVTGIVLGLFSRAFFASNFGGQSIWPFVESWRSHRKKRQRPKATGTPP
jgi:hypothetical protein